MGTFLPGIALRPEELAALFHYDDIAARIVLARPEEMFRRGYDLTGADAEPLAALVQRATLLRANEHLKDGLIWGRLFGGALVVVGADDGQPPELPLEEGRIRSIRYLNVVDRRFVAADSYYADPFAPGYGTPERYRLFGGRSTAIHATRVIRFDGALTDSLEMARLGGWTHSVLQRPHEKMRAFAQAFQATAHLLTDASQGVFSIQGLLQQVAANPDILQSRMAMIDMSRSVARSIMIDSETESFQRVATSFAGIPELLDRFMMFMSAAADMPVTLLMGRSPAGMNATGDADFRAFYDRIASEQETILKPALVRLYRLLALAQDSPFRGAAPELDVRFRPLWSPTEKEVAEARNLVAQADSSYITQGVLFPEEVALSRFGAGGYSVQTEIDEDARRRSLAAEVTFQPPKTEPEASDDAPATE